jgi:hypothetical protein
VYVWHRIRFLKLPCFVRGIFLCHELLSAGAVPIVCLANALEPLIRLDGRKAFDPAAQIGREHECATSTFHGTERARTNCLIESGPTGTRDGARFSAFMGDLATISRDGSGNRARVRAARRQPFTLI